MRDLEFYLLLIFFRHRKKNTLSPAIWISLALFTLGVGAVATANTIMHGYEASFRKILFSQQPHIRIGKETAMEKGEFESIVRTIGKVEGVATAKPAIFTKTRVRVAAIGDEKHNFGSVIFGLDLSDDNNTVNLAEMVGADAYNKLKAKTGLNLAANKGLYDMIVEANRGKSGKKQTTLQDIENARIVGVVETTVVRGMDFLIMNIENARKLLNLGNKATEVQVRLHDVSQIPKIRQIVEKKVGTGYNISDLASEYKENLSIIELQKKPHHGNSALGIVHGGRFQRLFPVFLHQEQVEGISGFALFRRVPKNAGEDHRVLEPRRLLGQHCYRHCSRNHAGEVFFRAQRERAEKDILHR